jgi:imidazole glycerol-phosphate synthase subunit HisH
LERNGLYSTLVRLPEDISGVSSLIIPGVGHFGAAAERGSASGVFDAIVEAYGSGNLRILGICLGFQLLCKSSEEGIGSGIGLLNAHVKRLPSNSFRRIPSMGWFELDNDEKFWKIQRGKSRFYFNHSYSVVPSDRDCEVVYYSNSNLVAVLRKDRILGCQFHPEKSHQFGDIVLQKFLHI